MNESPEQAAIRNERNSLRIKLTQVEKERDEARAQAAQYHRWADGYAGAVAELATVRAERDGLMFALSLARDELSALDKHFRNCEGKYGAYALEPNAEVMAEVNAALSPAPVPATGGEEMKSERKAS